MMYMKTLVCEICGGKLIMQSGGVAKCDSCGMEYTKERIQEKIQEIKGTVKIDSPVEVVKGDAEKERLLRNAEIFYDLKKYEDSRKFFSQICEQYTNEFRGWFGLYKSTLMSYFYDPNVRIGGGLQAEFRLIDENEANYSHAKKLCHRISSKLDDEYFDFWKSVPFYEIRMPQNRKMSLDNAKRANAEIEKYIDNCVKKGNPFMKKYKKRAKTIEELKSFFCKKILKDCQVKFDEWHLHIYLLNGDSIALMSSDSVDEQPYFCCKLKGNIDATNLFMEGII